MLFLCGTALEHQHLLSGIVCCPECGAPLYGSVNRKRKKDGTFYRDYWYYACKHRLDYDGHRCSFKKRIHQGKLNSAVETVIKAIVKNSQFDSAIKAKIDAGTDITALEKEAEELRKHIRQLTAPKDKLGSQIDRLDPTDKFSEEKCVDMQHRLDSLYEDIAEVNASLEDVMLRITGVKEQHMNKERVYEFLQLFDIIYDKFTGAEKKEFLQSFVKKIEIYPEPFPNGQILKSIQFHLPVYFQRE